MSLEVIFSNLDIDAVYIKSVVSFIESCHTNDVIDELCTTYNQLNCEVEKTNFINSLVGFYESNSKNTFVYNINDKFAVVDNGITDLELVKSILLRYDDVSPAILCLEDGVVLVY